MPTLFKKCSQDFVIYTNLRPASLWLTGHAAEAQWQITEQGVEEEVRHAV